MNCPRCKKPLHRDEEHLHCDHCGLEGFVHGKTWGVIWCTGTDDSNLDGSCTEYHIRAYGPERNELKALFEAGIKEGKKAKYRSR